MPSVPEAPGAESHNREASGRRRVTLLKLLKPYSGLLLFAVFAAVGEGVADLLGPWPLKLVFDDILKPKANLSRINTLLHSIAGDDKLLILKIAAISALAIAILGAVFSYIEKSCTTTVGQWVMHDLRRTLYAHIQRLSLSFHDESQTGDLISRVTSDIDTVQSFVTSGLLSVSVDIMTLVGMVVIMFCMNWRFTLIALSIAPVLFAVVFRYTRLIRKSSREVRKKEGQIVSIVQEVLTSIRVVKAFAREDYEQKRLEEESLESVEIALRARALKSRLAPIVEIIVGIGTSLVLWFGARMVLNGALEAGSLIIFIWYLGKMYKPMQDLSKMTDTYAKAAVGYERIQEVLQSDREVRDLPGARRAGRLRGELEFDHVTFGYEPGQPVLKDMSFKIEAGTVAALVGPTGAGKSTIISLIPRFYDPDSGVVKIDGKDVRLFQQKSIRDQVSFVLQETVLFHAPVWRNIAYGKPGASRQEILRAAQLANAHEFIEKMPEGYDTMIGERGVTLSGGQRQRIAIARAVIRDTPILILDEPSSGLDAASEQLVFEALDRLMEGKTSVVIAHRLATIQRANRIFVVKDGMIVESGTHESLMKEAGLYAELHQIQFEEIT
ncbi:MAG TPA: ABC transporter ATP-binding protein [Bryobacteraceae bacterium]|jgi:ATP-binding cassette subfamily B protein|nr:ABC transporter ATP-binding protein [Bryobacteraceae bacterium]